MLEPTTKAYRFPYTYLILLGFSLLYRWPYFFRDYIDRDESTFILMAQSWIDGHLPYTELWDLKPPLAFAFFVPIIAAFGKSLVMIRLFGSMLVALNALITFKIAKNHFSSHIALVLSLLCVALQSTLGSLQGVMSEHIGLFYFLFGVYLIHERNKFFWGFVMLSFSVFTKTNLAFGAALGFAFLMYSENKNRWNILFNASLAGLLTGFVILLPYAIGQNHKVLLDALIMAPLRYSEAGREEQLEALLSLSVPIALLLYIALKHSPLRFYMLSCLGILLSFVKSGIVNGHYLIQAYPFLLLAIYALPRVVKGSRNWAMVLLLLLGAESYMETYHLLKYRNEMGYWNNGEGHEVARFLKEQGWDEDTAYYTQFHIGHWLTGTNPLLPLVTHPTNIERPKLLPFASKFNEPIEVLHYLLDSSKPKIIVKRKGDAFTSKDLNGYLEQKLQTDYQSVFQTGKAMVYRLK